MKITFRLKCGPPIKLEFEKEKLKSKRRSVETKINRVKHSK